ncbi:unnamed protein product [Lactuca saligna]|uniref:Uncharacterized protein n=1 Tax=Lactuca saligna TaxID=75948 RepID=A0AA36E241_LACSI|nr:unnamed protein product [Lactuca saligna]
MLLSILFSLAGNLCRCHPLHRQPPPSLSNFQLPKTSQYLLTSPSFIVFLFHHQLDSINFNVIAIFSHKIDFFSIAGMLTPDDRQENKVEWQSLSRCKMESPQSIMGLMTMIMVIHFMKKKGKKQLVHNLQFRGKSSYGYKEYGLKCPI